MSEKKDTRFKPGVSGNPAGKPKGTIHKVPTNKQIKDAFKKNSRKALDILARIMDDSSEENKAARERAAIKILDYTYNIILQEDRLSIQKSKAKPEEDDDDDDTPDITVSLKAIK